MPLYEYTCNDCNTVTEKLMKHSDPDEEKDFQECSHCGEMAHRRISKNSFVLKGDWFKTKGTYG